MKDDQSAYRFVPGLDVRGGSWCNMGCNITGASIRGRAVLRSQQKAVHVCMQVATVLWKRTYAVTTIRHGGGHPLLPIPEVGRRRHQRPRAVVARLIPADPCQRCRRPVRLSAGRRL